ncbi:FIST C-terminal domain-containing protein [Vibrio sp. Of7-15]|uniref:FIST signal transduction protein n=1 Tax=Vibrio sp. Of7-15 TaxID=2724879 RepID=UPI001EF21DE7|nr:FIST N-terminal domain-containing protein [Vibrio sp. Of7-15]MCG7496332.1 FIST C-terminal domain-containing protein [Vibrio sp. Of7-15]
MKIITSSAQDIDTKNAIDEICKSFPTQNLSPSIILCYFTEEHDGDQVIRLLRECYPKAKIHGCSSCQGIMTDKGFFSSPAISVWALFDTKNGAYGTGLASFDQLPVHEATKSALFHAIKDTGRFGELPELLILHTTPGSEEEVLQAIEAELKGVPIVGGSAADNHIMNNWQIITQRGSCKNGVSISVYYPSCQISYSFHSGYISTGKRGVATKVDGRELIEINGQPAAQVYQQWTGLNLNENMSDNVNILTQSNLFPFGRIAGYLYESPYYKLTHPAKVTERGGLLLFSTITSGEEIYLMTGTRKRLITRAGRVIDSAIDTSRGQLDPIGGLNVYCAGCMAHIVDDMDSVRLHVNQAMHEQPYVCPFTFGEQGKFIGGENAHGNLMISTVLFHRS